MLLSKRHSSQSSLLSEFTKRLAIERTPARRLRQEATTPLRWIVQRLIIVADRSAANLLREA
jgi:hypothetical protein